jgi:hypothetical protein
MHQSIFRHPRWLLVLTGLLIPAVAQAQSDPDWATQRVWTSPVDVTPPVDSTSPPRPRANRIQLFRIVPGFLSDPVGLDSDDPKDATPNDGPDWLQVSMGNYNPYFDIRRPGDPGDVGYYKLHSQIQVFDTGATSLAVALQAVTPAGLDQDGVQDGPTVVSPALSLFHTLDDGTGIQGFIGKNMNLNPTSLSGPIHRQMQYGVAVQRPVLDTGPEKIGSFYLFVEALGRYRYDATATTTTATGPSAVWEMVPGVHWRLSDSVWLSGGVLMPVNAPTSSSHLWQLTCSFQF